MKQSDAPLIPRRVFFSNPDHVAVQISPDGANLGWLAPRNGVLNVWVAPRQDIHAARPVTEDTGSGIRFFTWAHSPGHLLFVQDRNGDENWRLYAVDLESGSTRDLTPFSNTQARLMAVSHRFPEEVVVGLNKRNAQWHDIYRINLVTGKLTLLLQHDRFLGVTVDNDYRLRNALQATLDGGMEIHVPSDSGWRLWDTIPMEDSMATSPIGFDKANRLMYMEESRKRNTSALVAVDPETGTAQLLAEDPKADLAGIMVHPTEMNVQAAAFVYDRKRWKIIDRSIEPDLEYLRTVADGDLDIVSRTRDDRFWVAFYLVDDGPARFYLYDREQRGARFLFSHRQALEGQPLVKMRSVIIRSRDDLDLVAYYSLPPGSDSNRDGIPDEPLPTVLMPHGGPWWRDFWGYNPLHQWLANRCCAVISVNFRASIGFGKSFANAGNREWGGRIMEDQIDAVRWCIGHGIADRKRVAVMGASFGGYSTLAGLTFTPEVFACGVDLCGPSNLVTFLKSVPAYWKPVMGMFPTRVGDPRTDEGRALLAQHSPLTYADRICRPLLIGQGANDPRVKRCESDQIVQAMQARNIPVTYVLYPDEGHGFARPENNMSFNAIAESFLMERLGGRTEPIGRDFEGSSLTVPVGEENVPGLAEALTKSQPGARGLKS